MNKEIFGVKPYLLKKTENYMAKPQLNHFKLILKNWQNTLMDSIDVTTTNMKTDENNYPDPIDRASKEEEFTLELRTRDRERKLLKKIELSLGKIESKNYGYCNICDAPIGVKRLEARAVADMCVDCKTVTEKKEI